MQRAKIKALKINKRKCSLDIQNNVIFWLVWFLCLMAYQLFLGHLMPKSFS